MKRVIIYIFLLGSCLQVKAQDVSTDSNEHVDFLTRVQTDLSEIKTEKSDAV